MYAIIYKTTSDGDGDTTELLEILSGNIDADNWNAGDTGISYTNCTDEEDLDEKATALNADWKSQFEVIYIKN